MNYFGVILVVLATTAIHQNEARPSDSLDRMRNAVDKTVVFLRSYKDDLAVNGDKKFDLALEKETARIARAVNQTLQEIQNAVEEATNDGQNAGECYESAQSTVNDAQNRVLPVVQACFANNKPNWQPSQTTAEGLIERGDKLLQRIDEIKSECAKSVQEQRCIIPKLPEIGASLGSYKAGVGLLRKQVGIATSAGFKAARQCSELPLRSFKDELKAASHSAHECIQSAPENVIKS